MRNIGSSVGTSMVTTLLARRAQLHQLRLVEYTRPDNPNFQNTLTGLSQQAVHSGLSAPDARAQALARIYEQVQAHANSLAYIDTFMVLAVVSAIMVFVAFTLKKNDPGAGGAPRLE
jgi:DHA2 family multidrug resistance protein